MHFAVSILCIEAILLGVIFAKICSGAVKKGPAMGKYRRNDWAIVGHSDAFWTGCFAMLLTVKWALTCTLFWCWHAFCAT